MGLRTALLVLPVVFSASARAQPNAAARGTAREMMDAGHTARDAGDHAAALVQFQGADAIMHLSITGLETAREQISLGQLVEALDTLERVVRVAPNPSDPDVLREARTAAASLERDLVERIPALKVTVSGAPPGAAVVCTIDGVAIPEVGLVSPFKVDPGRHVIVGTAAGVAARRSVEVREGEVVPVVLALTPAHDSATSEAAPAATPVSDPNATTSASGLELPAVRALRWVGVGVVGVGVIVGAVTGLVSLSAASSTESECVKDRCPPSTWSDLNRARVTGNVSTVAFIVAGTGAAVAIATFLIKAPSARSSADGHRDTTGRVTLSVVPGGASIRGEF